MIFKLIKLFLEAWDKYERALLQIRCLVSDKNSTIEKEINKFSINRRKYAMYKTCRLAFWGYPLNIIINELKYLRS